MFLKLSYPVRQAMSASLAVLFSLVIATYFKIDNHFWVALAAFLVCLTSPGASLRQSLIIAALMMSAVFAAIFLHAYFDSLYINLIILFTSIYLTSLFYPLTNLQFAFLTIFPLLLLTYFSSIDPENAFIALMIGAGVGIITATLIKIRKTEVEFKQDLAPLMQLICEYANSLSVSFQETKFSQDYGIKSQIETEISAWCHRYPEWVFNTGFNPGLRIGYRYFLIKVDQIIEVLFSLSYWFAKPIEADSMNQIRDAITKVLKTNLDLLNVISHYINDKPLPTSAANYLDDIQELESASATLLPQAIELLDLNSDGLVISAIFKDLKELRQLSIQLIAALPAS